MFASQLSADTVLVDGAQQFQTIDGFGVNCNTESWNRGELKPALDLLVDQLGATLFRAVIEEMDWEAVNDNNDPNRFNWTYYNSVYSNPKFEQVWNTLRYLNRKGIEDGLIISLMGKPPGWMGGNAEVNPSSEDEFVEMIASLLHYARHKAGIRFHLVSPMNEPDTGGVEGPDMKAPQFARILHKLAVKLDAIGLGDVRFVGPDAAGSFQIYFDEIVKDSLIMAKMGHWGLHFYGRDASGIQNSINASAYPKVNFWVTESAGFRQTVPYHLQENSAADIVWDGFDAVYHHAIRAGRGSSPPNDSPGIEKPLIAYDSATHLYAPRKGFFEHAQLFKFVLPGARRIGVDNESTDLVVQAFLNPTGQLVIIGCNNGSGISLTCKLANLPLVSEFAIYQTNSKLNLSRGSSLPVTEGAFSLTVDAGTTFTLVGSTMRSSPPSPSTPVRL